jgi:hypothetical protein
VDLLRNCIVVLLELGRILRVRNTSGKARRGKKVIVRTFVAMTIWSRFVRASIHSPMIISDCSSWLQKTQ